MWKRIRIAIVVGLITTALLIGSQLKAQEIPTRVAPQPQCVKVLVEDRDGRSGGTGSLIGPRLVVTCNHVVKDMKKGNKRVEILFPDWQLIDATLVKVDSKADLALIVLDKAPLGITPLYMVPLRPGQPLAVQGYGYGPYKQSWGVLNGSGWGKYWRMVEGATARSGDSGGPVLDEAGDFVGTLWGSAANDGTYFTPSAYIIKFAKDWLPQPDNVNPDPGYIFSDSLRKQ